MEREVVVRGSGEARALPDLATLTVEVTADHKSRDEAYQARTLRAARVDEVLTLHKDAIARTTIASLWVQPLTRWHRGEELHTGWRASRTSFVEVSGLDALGDIMSGLVEAGAAVRGPEWSMAPTNPAYDRARRIAAEDARHRAESYAEALGLLLGPVAWVAEPGLRDGLGKPPGPIPVAALAARSDAGTLAAAGTPPEPSEPTENLTPSEMAVEVALEVGFGII
jgi:uncharacterized protein YggE